MSLLKKLRKAFTGPVGPIGADGRDGRCACANRVQALEATIVSLELRLGDVEAALRGPAPTAASSPTGPFRRVPDGIYPFQ